MKQLNMTAVCVLVLVYLLVGMGGMAGRVMCLGADGHVGTKTAGDISCDESSEDPTLPNSRPSQASTEDSFSSDEDHCGPCVDVPIPSNGSLHKSVSSQRASKHVQRNGCATSTHKLPEFCESTAGGPFSARSPETNSTLHSIRTVVLLI